MSDSDTVEVPDGALSGLREADEQPGIGARAADVASGAELKDSESPHQAEPKGRRSNSAEADGGWCLKYRPAAVGWPLPYLLERRTGQWTRTYGVRVEDLVSLSTGQPVTGVMNPEFAQDRDDEPTAPGPDQAAPFGQDVPFTVDFHPEPADRDVSFRCQISAKRRVSFTGATFQSVIDQGLEAVEAMNAEDE